MLGNSSIERFDNFVMERRHLGPNLGQVKHLSLTDRCICIYDGMKALALGKTRVDGWGKAAQLHGKADVPVADEHTRYKLPSGSRDDSLADRVLKVTFPSKRKTQYLWHKEFSQRFPFLRRLNSV